MAIKILIFPIRLVWRIFTRVSTAVLLPVSATVWLARLLPYFAHIRRAELVVLMTRPDGFGHSISGPDVARRMAPGKRILFFVASGRFENNPAVSQLFQDMRVVFIPRFVLDIQFPDEKKLVLPFKKLHDAMLQWLTRRIVRLVGGEATRFAELKEIYSKMINSRRSRPVSEQGAKFWNGDHAWEIGYAELGFRQSAPPLHLPENVGVDLKEKFRKLWRDAGRENDPKLCCLYLRYEKPKALAGNLRNTADVTEILPAIRLLNDAGYQVVLVGDRKTTPELRREFKGGLVDDASIGCARDVYQLFAASEADIFIGNNGGGVVLPQINAIPSLLIDYYPVASAFWNGWHYYKAAFFKDGTPVPARRLLAEYSYDLYCSYGSLRDNSCEEICEAITQFLEDLKTPGGVDPHADIAALMPRDTPFAFSNARISPAWVRKYILNSAQGEVDSPASVDEEASKQKEPVN